MGSTSNRTLDAVGFFEVFLTEESCSVSKTELKALPMEGASYEDLGVSVLESHRILSELNDKNRDAFRSVVEGLEEELESKDLT